jgi:hypothetical protein
MSDHNQDVITLTDEVLSRIAVALAEAAKVASEVCATGDLARAEAAVARWRELEAFRVDVLALAARGAELGIDLSTSLTAASHGQGVGAEAATENDHRLESWTESEPDGHVATPTVDSPEDDLAPLVAEESVDLLDLPAPVQRPKPDRKAAKAFFDAANALPEHEWSPAEVARARAVVCQGRAVIDQWTRAGENAGAIYDDIGRLELAFEERAPADAEFFGFGGKRFVDQAQWEGLAEGYRLLAEAWEALPWLESREEFDDRAREALLGASACQALAHRRAFAVIHALDRPIARCYDRLKALAERVEVFVPYWKVQGPDGVPEEDVLAAALQFTRSWRTAVEEAERRTQLEGAWKEFEEALSACSSDGFEERLPAAVIRLLELKVPPSDRRFKPLIPYRAILQSHPLAEGKGQYPRLLEFLSKSETQMLAKRAIAEDVDAPEDEGHAARENELRAHLEGKTLLFVGGNKGQGFRREEFKRRLNLKEVLWPDSEDHHSADFFASDRRKADVVAMLVRWSRHDYKRVIDEAKREGKMTAMVRTGLGYRTVINALHEQLLGSSAGREGQ